MNFFEDSYFKKFQGSRHTTGMSHLKFQGCLMSPKQTGTHEVYN